jgi:hypothetical protein
MYLLKKHGVATTPRFVDVNVCIQGKNMGMAAGVKAHMHPCFTLMPGCLIVVLM